MLQLCKLLAPGDRKVAAEVALALEEPARYFARVVPLCSLVLTACAGTGAAPSPTVTEIAPGAYVRAGRHGVVFEATNVANIGFLVGERCVAVVDGGGSPDEGLALERAIRAITPLPVCYVIATHVHPDHILGNGTFAASGARVVGHAKLARALGQRATTYLERAAAQAGRPVGPDALPAPGITVADTLTLDLGNRTLELTAHRSAHTDTDLTVYDRATRTLWLGDLVFLEHVPVLDGNLSGWLAVLDTLAAVDAERAVPGHGPTSISWPDGAGGTVRYLTSLRDDVRAAIAAGDDLRTAQETAGYTEARRWQLYERYQQRNIAAAFAELEWE